MIDIGCYTALCSAAGHSEEGRMDQRESPAVARRRLRLGLRRLREASGLTQSEVADRLKVSLSKVARIELGESSVSNADLQALLRVFDVTDEKQSAELNRHWEAARARAWWDDSRYRTHVTPGTIELLQFESDARTIYTFHPTLVPGIVQTPAYSEAILALWPDLPTAERDIRLDFRMRLREHVLDRPDRPGLVLIIDESVLSREVGGPRLMIEQMRDLLAVGGDERIAIHVLPLAPFAVLSLEAPFVLLEMGDEDFVLYKESTLTDELLDNPDVVARYRGIVKQMLAKSLSVDASMRLIEAKAATLASALDRI
jgi:transcriptional regulator with XRE-family HTH domain